MKLLGRSFLLWGVVEAGERGSGRCFECWQRKELWGGGGKEEEEERALYKRQWRQHSLGLRWQKRGIKESLLAGLLDHHNPLLLLLGRWWVFCSFLCHLLASFFPCAVEKGGD